MEYIFMKKFRPEENMIKEFDYWIVLIREKQITIGSMIIIPKREIASVSDLLPKEAAEFPQIIKWFERVTKRLYGAEKFNYIIAMMKDNFVHYHAIPRYSKPVERYGIVWKDTCWPDLIHFCSVTIDKDILNMIKKDIRNS